MVATVVLGVLAVICAVGLLFFTERFGVTPACQDYATVHGWQYLSMETYSDPIGRRSGAICTFRSDTGSRERVRLLDVSVLTNFWVSFAVSLYITIPAFLILFAVLRTWLWKLRSTPSSQNRVH